MLLRKHRRGRENIQLWLTFAHASNACISTMPTSEGTARSPSGVEDVVGTPKAGGRTQVWTPHRQVCQGYRAQGRRSAISSRSVLSPPSLACSGCSSWAKLRVCWYFCPVGQPPKPHFLWRFSQFGDRVRSTYTGVFTSDKRVASLEKHQKLQPRLRTQHCVLAQPLASTVSP